MSSAPQYHCRQPRRVAALKKQSALNGIEYLEVASADQRTLQVVFALPLPGSGDAQAAPPGGTPLAPANVRIEGGVRIRDIAVTAVHVAGHVLTVTTDAAGDFSEYTLRLVAGDLSDDPPPGYDPRLAALPFSFKAGCPGELDCRFAEVCPPEVPPEPDIPYLAKDYSTFRKLMLDRLAVLMPGWRDRSPADPLVMVVEALALTADHLSYWQDAVATEAYLGTARERVSLRRHARLLDYRMHDGINARAWVHVQFAGVAGSILPVDTVVLSRGGEAGPVLASDGALKAALREGPVAFATRHEVRLDPAHNAIPFHTWSDAGCCLPKGATRATLSNQPARSLEAGDWLLLEEVCGRETGNPADADPARRQVVRLTSVVATIDPLDGTPVLEVAWDAADALRFPLSLATPPGGSPGSPVSVARGNLVLADHGLAVGPELVALEGAATGRAPRARLVRRGATQAEPFDAGVFAEEGREIGRPPGQRSLKTFLTAAAALATDPARALPAVQLELAGESWNPQRELLASDRFAREFVVETAQDGTAMLRFGDGTQGLRPPDGAVFSARYRIGNGQAGNVGADSLARIRTDLAGVVAVRNPLPATGGTDPESSESVRQFAPQAFRVQERAVTEADWVEVAQRHPDVQRAAAQFRWTGSWHTVFLTIDRRGGLPVEGDPRFLADLVGHLGRYRLAGYDLEVRGPVWVPLDLVLEICVKPGHFRSAVKAALLEVFSARLRPDGRRGFFHPDEFTFGQPVYLSRLVEAAMGVPGVNDLEVVKFQRFGRRPTGEVESGRISIGPFEIARCDRDPSLPENGRIELVMEGGL